MDFRHAIDILSETLIKEAIETDVIPEKAFSVDLKLLSWTEEPINARADGAKIRRTFVSTIKRFFSAIKIDNLDLSDVKFSLTAHRDENRETKDYFYFRISEFPNNTLYAGKIPFTVVRDLNGGVSVKLNPADLEKELKEFLIDYAG